MEIHVGIDFGTSFTKAYMYNLDLDEPALIDLRSESQSGSPYLPSLLWIDSNDMISIEQPASGCPRKIEYFKMALANQLIGSDIYPTCNIKNKPYFLYCAFYLAKIMSIIEIFIKRKYSAYLRKENIDISGSVGIPVAHFDSPIKDVYEKIIAASSFMKNLIGDREPISRIDEFYSESLTHSKDERFTAIPELYAEAAGIISDRHTPTGVYTIFDIGGGTVDGASFYLEKRNGNSYVNFLTAKVEPLGLEIVANRIVQAGIEKTMPDARTLLYKSETISNQSIDSLKNSLHQLTAKVIVPVKKKNPDAFHLADSIPISICGGGRLSQWHKAVILDTYTNFKHKNCNIPPYKLFDLNPYYGNIPAPLLHRYTIAIGLSIPPGYGPEIIGFPSQNPEFHQTNKDANLDYDEIQREIYGD
ncbi:MAG: hypothetical protein GX438_11075 [Treponema sp.]|nr:hypothetical protein [Treponema sp.]